ncbi:MAG: TetR family transcriptional regulator [Alphaproteobacteria bacterium]|nr:TetR family transcriptional regulator [Alphaproteobacteria bacterium]
MTKSDAKAQMLRAAMTLFRKRGFEGVGLAELLEVSGAPRGSLYFHFPGGKTQLVQEAIRSVSAMISERVRERARKHKTAESYINNAMSTWAHDLEDSAYQNGCLVAVAALESASDAPEIAEVAREAFSAWEHEIAIAAMSWGMTESDAAIFASAMIGAIEGAIVLSRARKSPKPFEDANRAMQALARELLGRNASHAA